MRHTTGREKASAPVGSAKEAAYSVKLIRRMGRKERNGDGAGRTEPCHAFCDCQRGYHSQRRGNADGTTPGEAVPSFRIRQKAIADDLIGDLGHSCERK
jgi:hypothetical protein